MLEPSDDPDYPTLFRLSGGPISAGGNVYRYPPELQIDDSSLHEIDAVMIVSDGPMVTRAVAKFTIIVRVPETS